MVTIRRWQLIVAVLVGSTIGVASGHLVAQRTDSTPKPTPAIHQTCDLSLLLRNFRLLDQGYTLATTGHPKQAINLVRPNYAVMSSHECGL